MNPHMEDCAQIQSRWQLLCSQAFFPKQLDKDFNYFNAFSSTPEEGQPIFAS